MHPLLQPKTISITQVILTVMFSMIAGSYVAIISLMVW